MPNLTPGINNRGLKEKVVYLKWRAAHEINIRTNKLIIPHGYFLSKI